LVTSNLGFAVTSNSLKPLLKKPNPVPMNRWLTIGALDAKEWQNLFGAHWRRGRGGHIVVDGAGSGFGGRSLLLSAQPAPSIPFELRVTVRLNDESGAAGLVFHSDGGDKHYGFYPSGGQLRFTRFDGPDVFSWHILHQEPSPHYRTGDWNALRVHVEKDKIRCFVNDQFVFETTDTGLKPGRVGLAKFRDTQAEFKQFRVGKQSGDTVPSPDVTKRITQIAQRLAPDVLPGARLVDSLVPDGAAGVAVLRQRAKLLERQAAQMRALALGVHQRRIQNELAKLVQDKDEDFDLVQAALLIAKLDNEELDVASYRKDIDRMAGEVAAGVTKGMDEKAKLAVLNKYLFTDHGFHGSRSDYYNRANSYLNEVLDDREGLPITLSILYMEMARRLGVKVVGVGLPGHFVVRLIPAKGEPQLIDVFEGGTPMTRADADRKVKSLAGRPLEEKDLAEVSKRAILVRILHNLLGIVTNARDAVATLRYLDTILAIDPDAAQERGTRAMLRYQTGRRQEALDDVDWLLERKPEGLDVDKLREFRRMLDKSNGT
jgi:regulator of sirC expression with transglutaminase-like and TPR domain